MSTTPPPKPHLPVSTTVVLNSLSLAGLERLLGHQGIKHRPLGADAGIQALIASVSAA